MLGIPISDIDLAVRAQITGAAISKFRDKEGDNYNIVLRMPFKDKPAIEDLERVYLSSVTGAQIPLSQVANIGFKSGFKMIDHFNLDRSTTITADVKRNYFVLDVTNEILDKLESHEWAENFTYYIAGEKESQEKSFGGMGKALIIALIGIFAVLVIQFKSFTQPLIVYSAIPFAFVGSILALLITGNPFSFSAFLGLTSLVGIVVNNSILLADHANQEIRKGKTIVEAIKDAGITRFNPIILTTLTTVGGLLPLTLRGGEQWAPMGWTIIGGLLLSTILTLVIVPVLYKLYKKKTEEAQVIV